MLIDSETKKPFVVERVHGNKKILNLITGKNDLTMGQWGKKAMRSGKEFLKAMKSPAE